MKTKACHITRGHAWAPLGLLLLLGCVGPADCADPAAYPGSVPNPDGTYTWIFRPSGGANNGTDTGGLLTGKDSFILNNENPVTANTNNGTADYTHHFNSNCNVWWGWSYFQWDLAALPPATDVERVILVLHQRIIRGYGWGYQVPQTEMVVRAPTAAWNEMTLTYNNRPPLDPTVLARAYLRTDTPIPGVVAPPALCWFDGLVRLDVTDLFRQWAAGTRPNHGIVYQRAQVWCENANANYVYTSDHADATKRPALEIVYRGAPVDDFPPELTLPGDLVVEATGPGGAIVEFTATAFDGQDGPVPVTCTPASGSVFPLGTTLVEAVAEDEAGNRAQSAFAVTVRDTTPPILTSLTATPAVLSPPNHRLVTVQLSAVIDDLVDRSPFHSIVTVQSSEPVNGTGDGDTQPDWVITGPMQVDLRAERAGTGNGRLYTITVEACDASGNLARRSVTVSVPKHAGRK